MRRMVYAGRMGPEKDSDQYVYEIEYMGKSAMYRVRKEIPKEILLTGESAGTINKVIFGHMLAELESKVGENE